MCVPHVCFCVPVCVHTCVCVIPKHCGNGDDEEDEEVVMARGLKGRGREWLSTPVIRPISLKPGPVADDQLIACLVCVCVRVYES